MAVLLYTFMMEKVSSISLLGMLLSYANSKQRECHWCLFWIFMLMIKIQKYVSLVIKRYFQLRGRIYRRINWHTWHNVISAPESSITNCVYEPYRIVWLHFKHSRKVLRKDGFRDSYISIKVRGYHIHRLFNSPIPKHRILSADVDTPLKDITWCTCARFANC